MPDPVPSSVRHQVEVGSVAIRWQVRGSSAEAELDPVVEPGSQDGTDGPAPSAEVVTQVADRLTEIATGLRDHQVQLHLAADHPAHTERVLPEAVADAVGLTHRRDLLQLRRPLPVPPDHPARTRGPQIPVRTFDADRDTDAWLRVNNRASADHPDQGRETTDTLRARMAEPWFDAEDFLVADEPVEPVAPDAHDVVTDRTPDAGSEAELAGFCWTKVHPDTDGTGPIGEIYVIGVDPRHHGEGLGATLVLAGLDHLAQRGIRTAMLFVDADNAPARRLYDRLGFTTHQRRRVYSSPAPHHELPR